MKKPTSADFELLKDNVKQELLAQNSLQKLDLNDQQIDTLAWAISTNVDYVFHYQSVAKPEKKDKQN